MNLPTIETVTSPYLHFPKIIQRAILLVDTHPTFNGITKGARRVLKALMTRAEKTDGCAPIEAKLLKVAEEADVDRKTVTRALQTFHEAGWISEMSHGRKRRGKWCGTTLICTPDLCRLVGLPVPEKDDQGTQMSHGVYVDLTFEKDYREIQREKRKANPTPVALPPELAAITTEMAIKDTGVAKLRGMAHDAGYRLQDIVACAREHLLATKATGNRVFRYLETMIGKRSDYAARAAKITRHAAIVAEVDRYAAQAAKYAHKRFKAGPGEIIRTFDGTAEVTRDGQYVGTLAGRTQMAHLYDAIDAGKVRPVEA